MGPRGWVVLAALAAGPAAGAAQAPPFAVVDTADGLSMYEDLYVLPATWSRRYEGEESEVVFQLSAKVRIFHTRLFFGYTQVAFWQLFNASESRPFRETSYSPELFYRITPSRGRLKDWIVDLGLEHESNGSGEPDSRSWNRAYAAVHRQGPRHLVSLRLWYRFREDVCPTGEDGLELEHCRDDASYDDNPDITDFMGYGELQVRRRWLRGSPRELHLIVRGNPATGKGGVGLGYSHASGSEDLRWFVKAHHGYGESLIDHDRSITRLGLGLLLRRPPREPSAQ